MSADRIPPSWMQGIGEGGAYRAYNNDNDTKVAYNPNQAIDFNERERYVDLSGVSAFCHPQA